MLLTGAAALPATASEPPYPAKPVRLVVGFAPGGGTDILARLLGQKLSEVLGQPFVIENRAGATGMIGAKVVATSAPDGYTLLMGHVNSQAIAPALMERPSYDPVKDFSPITYIGSVANVLVVPRDLPAKDTTELLALARTRSKGLSYGSPGVGSTNHLAGELLRLDTKASLTHVPYRGSGPAMVDLLSGVIDMNFDVVPSVMPNVKAGLLRPLAVTTQQRDPDLPNVPTMTELGFKSFDINNWYGMMAPRGVPADVIRTLHEALRNVLRQPDVVARLADMGVRGSDMTTGQFSEFLHRETSKYHDIAKRTGIQIQQ